MAFDPDAYLAEKKIQFDPDAYLAGKVAKEAPMVEAKKADYYGPHYGSLEDGESAPEQLGLGAIRGAGSIGSTLLWPIDAAKDYILGDRKQNIEGLITGEKPLSRHQERVAGINEGLVNLGANPESGAYKTGKILGEVAGTAGAGGLVAAPVRVAAPSLSRLATALESGGMTIPEGGNIAANTGLRLAGGAAAGGTGAALIDPSQARTGAAIGAAIPIPLRVAGSALSGAKALAAPLYDKGQSYTLGNMLEDFSHNKEAALSNLRASSGVFPSGALQTTAEASGDIGLTGLTRGLQSSSPDFSNNLASRFFDQNNARTQMIDEIAGNPGKIEAAKMARDEATSAMREKALDEAGGLPAGGIVEQIDALLKDPNNAGKLSQQALGGIKNQVERNIDESGNVSARAIYAIRKDINDILGGKLQGDEGNLRYAAGQLSAVKNIFDNSIESAIGSGTSSASREIIPYSAPGTEVGNVVAPESPNSFKQYLKTYSDMSKPISQMEDLQDIYKRIQNGTPDNQGNMMLSGAKLNNIMKNEGQELGKKLSGDQLDVLRNLSGELNASTLGINSGRSVGSNTAQNYIIDKAINETLGKIGLGEIGKNTIGGIGKAIYSRANESIMRKLGDALLDPKGAEKLMTEAQLQREINRKLSEALQSGAKPIPAAAAAITNQ